MYEGRKSNAFMVFPFFCLGPHLFNPLKGSPSDPPAIRVNALEEKTLNMRTGGDLSGSSMTNPGSCLRTRAKPICSALLGIRLDVDPILRYCPLSAQTMEIIVLCQTMLQLCPILNLALEVEK